MALPCRYDSFNFEPYKFQEYPKAIKHNDKDFIVNSAEEEKELKSKARDYRKEALDRASDLGIEVGSDWEVAKIQAFIKKAEADLEFAKFDEEKPQTTNKLKLPTKTN